MTPFSFGLHQFQGFPVVAQYPHALRCDLIPPRQTQRPVFPHWAYPETLALDICRELRG